MVGCVIVPGLPAIAPHLGWGHQPGWLVTLPSLGVVLFGPLAGKCIESIGPRRSLLSGLLLYGALGMAAIWLTGAPALVDRLLLGAATAVVMSSGTMLLTGMFDGPKRMKIMALQGMSIELGGVVFLALGGALMQFGWAAPFGLYGVAWALALLLLLFVPRELDGERARGRGEQGSCAAQPNHGRTGTSREKSSEELRQCRQTVDPSAAQQTRPAPSPSPSTATGGQADRRMPIVYVAALLSMVVFFTAVVGLPFRLGVPKEEGGPALTEAQVGYYLSAVSLFAVLAASQMPQVVRRITELRTLALAFGCYAVGHLLLCLAGPALSTWLCAIVFLGTGFGLSVPLVNHLTVEWSPASRRGRHLAYLSMCLFMGQFLAAFTNLLPGSVNSGFGLVAILGCVAAGWMGWASLKQRA